MTQQPLLPCPFCGGKYTMLETWFYDCDHYWVQCQNPECGATSGSFEDDSEIAIAAWNSRADTGQAAPRWEPVENGAYHFRGNDVIVEGHLLGIAEHGKPIYAGALPENIRLCRAVEGDAPGAMPEEVRETIWQLLKFARYDPSGENGPLIKRIDAALAWLDSQPTAP